MRLFPVKRVLDARNFLRQVVPPAPAATVPAEDLPHVHLDPDSWPGVAQITLHNPRRHNAMTPAMMVQLGECVDRLAALYDADIGQPAPPARKHTCVVVRGSLLAPSFCTGVDLSVARAAMVRPECGQAMSLVMTDALNRLRQLPLISVALVHGWAMGGGAEMAVACDLRAMLPGARLQFVQRRMGVTPGWGGAGRLVDLVGQRRALRLLCAMPVVDEQMAADLGLSDGELARGDTAMAASWDSDGDAVAKESSIRQAVNTAILSPYLSSEMDPAADQHVVRQLKRAVVMSAAVIDEGSVESAEHSIFASLWGTGRNAAVLSTTKP